MTMHSLAGLLDVECSKLIQHMAGTTCILFCPQLFGFIQKVAFGLTEAD